jgi:DNA-binding MarR family transcriptional regulator
MVMNKEEPLSRLLGLILRIYKNRLTALLKENNITLRPEQFMILHELSVGEDLTQQDLSNHLQKDKSIVLRQIATLMEAGYVIRLQDKVDKRKKKLSLTKKGVIYLIR